MFPLLLALAFAAPQPPVWIQRANVPPPIVAWRIRDVLGTPIPEGIAVDRDANAGTLAVSVVDRGKEAAYLLRVGRSFTLELVRTRTGRALSPRVFSR